LAALAFLTILVWQGIFPNAQETGSCQVGCGGEESKIAPRQLEFPYYSLRDGFNSTLILVNVSPEAVDLTIALHSRSGQTLLAPAMTAPGQQKLSLDVAEMLAGLAADVTGDFAEGSISVYFVGKIMPITGQLTMSNPLKNMSFETEMVDNSPGLFLLPKQQHGLWWGLGGGRDARIAVTNTSGASATADVFLDFQAERHAIEPLVFAPHETKVLSVVELLGALKVSPAEAPEGGITLVPRGPTPMLVAQGRITDPVTGFSTTLNFLDPSMQLASALHASGLPIGLPRKGSPFAGMGTFTPHVIVRNLLGTPQTATVTVEYPTDEGPARTALAPLALAAYETRDFSLDAVMGQLPLPLAYASIRIEYSGPPGSTIAEVASIEAKGDLVVDGRLANEGDGWAGSGGNPWHLDEETDSVLFLTNMSDQSCRMGVRVDVQGKPFFITDVNLKPHETRAMDIRQLRDAQKADFKKTLIPAGATDGSVAWIRLENLPVMGRVAMMKRHGGMASSYQCQICPCTASFISVEEQEPNPDVPILPGQTCQHTARGLYGGCWYPFYSDITTLATWTSLTPSIATVNNTTYKGRVTGVAGGTATIKAYYQGISYIWSGGYPGYCQVNGLPTDDDTRTCDVRRPGWLQVLSYTYDTIPCTAGGTTTNIYRRLVRYKVLDDTPAKNPIHRAFMRIDEYNGAPTNDSCATGSPTNGWWSTDTNGAMPTGNPDGIATCCSTCNLGSFCSEEWNQSFSVTGYQRTYSVGVIDYLGVSGSHNHNSTSCGAIPSATASQ
jgi:hypothetical protein